MASRRARAALGALAAAAMLGAPASAAEGDDPAFGRWVVEDGKAVIEIHACGEQACGRIVWLRQPFGPDGRAKRDVENPNPGKRSRPLCRLRLISGLKRTDPGVWEGGEVYSTRDGATYGFEIEGVEDDRMTVRGYLGLPLLGRSRVWRRDGGMRGSCTPFELPGTTR